MFRSNWELASTRAVSVIEQLLKNEKLESKRFLVAGFGENKPIAPNDTPENRSKNRRVELIILQGPEYEVDEDEVINIEKESDVPLPEITDDLLEPTFPPHFEVTSSEVDGESGASDLGIFEEDALYNYELDDVETPDADATGEVFENELTGTESGDGPGKSLEQTLQEGLDELPQEVPAEESVPPAKEQQGGGIVEDILKQSIEESLKESLE